MTLQQTEVHPVPGTLRAAVMTAFNMPITSTDGRQLLRSYEALIESLCRQFRLFSSQNYLHFLPIPLDTVP